MSVPEKKRRIGGSFKNSRRSTGLRFSYSHATRMTAYFSCESVNTRRGRVSRNSSMLGSVS
jgi:hypothetical protein